MKTIKDDKLNNTKLIEDVCQLIDKARMRLAVKANHEITVLYWEIGNRINTDLLDGNRAPYGKQIVSQLATILQSNYGRRGFESRNIRRMMQ